MIKIRDAPDADVRGISQLVKKAHWGFFDRSLDGGWGLIS